MQVKQLAPSLGGLRAERIESLLAARLFVEPQLVDDTLYFVSNLSGRLSLYAMDADGGVPTPLLPPRIALQNPELIGGHLFHVAPELGGILVLLDHDGDENYEPFFVPLAGGFPEPIAPGAFHGRRAHLIEMEDATAYFAVESREESLFYAFRLDLNDETVEELGRSTYGAFPVAWTPDHARVVLADEYLLGDTLLYELADGERTVLYGTPIEEREEGRKYPPSGIRWPRGTDSGKGLLLVASVFDDAGTPAYLDFSRPGELEPVAVEGIVHEGVGELDRLQQGVPRGRGTGAGGGLPVAEGEKADALVHERGFRVETLVV